MIYVEEIDFSRQIELLKFISSRSNYLVCAWLYPESNVQVVANQVVSLNNDKIIPVTEYDDVSMPKHTILAPCSINVLNTFLSANNEVIKNCDSIALYKENQSNWHVATIGHEGMCLVKDVALLSVLINAGFCASLEAPSWW